VTVVTNKWETFGKLCGESL